MRTETPGARNLTFEQERRRHPRYSVQDLPVLVDDGSDSLRVRDLSRSGACFFSETPIRMMTHVRFSFALPGAGGDQVIQGEGVVVRCERISPAVGHYEVALFFQDLADEHITVLENYLSELDNTAEA